MFTCVGVYPAIKNALKKRGWIEKTGPLSIVRSANTAMFRGEFDYKLLFLLQSL